MQRPRLGLVTKSFQIGKTTAIRVAFLGIMGAPLKPLGPSKHYRVEGFKAGPKLTFHYAETRQTLGQVCG